jgi:hypothetical protein
VNYSRQFSTLRSFTRLNSAVLSAVRGGRPQVEVEGLDLLDQGIDARVVRPAVGAVIGSVPQLCDDDDAEAKLIRRA